VVVRRIWPNPTAGRAAWLAVLDSSGLNLGRPVPLSTASKALMDSGSIVSTRLGNETH
jgi:hypothetical protein